MKFDDQPQYLETDQIDQFMTRYGFVRHFEVNNVYSTIRRMINSGQTIGPWTVNYILNHDHEPEDGIPKAVLHIFFTRVSDAVMFRLAQDQ